MMVADWLVGNGLHSISNYHADSRITLHRPQKSYERLRQHGIHSKHQIGRLISWEPNIVGCWKLERFYSTWSFDRITHGPKEREWNYPYNHYIIPRHNFVPVSMEVNLKVSIYFLSNWIVSIMIIYLAAVTYKKNKRINDIICNWRYMIWFSPEIIVLPMVAFPLQVITTLVAPVNVVTYHKCINGKKLMHLW